MRTSVLKNAVASIMEAKASEIRFKSSLMVEAGFTYVYATRTWEKGNVVLLDGVYRKLSSEELKKFLSNNSVDNGIGL